MVKEVVIEHAQRTILLNFLKDKLELTSLMN